MQTVREYLETNKNITGVHMMTPAGFVDLDKTEIEDLLNMKNVQSHAGTVNTIMDIDAEEVLESIVHGDIQQCDDGSTAFMTVYAS